MNIYEKIGIIVTLLIAIIPLLLDFIDNYKEYKKTKKKLENFDFNKSSVTNESGMELYIGDDISSIRKSLQFDEDKSFENCMGNMIGILISLGFIVYTIFFV
jgi:hypothetical protein